LIRPYVRLDIYGSDGSLTFLGETKTPLAVRHVKRLEKKIETVRMREPELLRGQGCHDDLRNVGTPRSL
jgi:hypothetical protein